jgi:hypothetical protein
MKTTVSLLAVALPALAMSASAQANAPTLFSGFASSLEGWTKVAEQTTSISHAPSGGNPGGYARNSDQGPSAGDILAPPSWLGDWRGYEGGRLSWDFRLFSPGVNDGSPFLPTVATLTGPGGTAVFTSTILPTVAAGWYANSVPMHAVSWTVTGGTWAGVLTNVTEFKLQIEAVFSTGFPGEVTGIDNVMLSPVPVPEPASALLLALGLGCCGAAIGRCAQPGRAKAQR